MCLQRNKLSRLVFYVLHVKRKRAFSRFAISRSDIPEEHVEDIEQSASFVLARHAIGHRHVLGPGSRRQHHVVLETHFTSLFGNVNQNTIFNRLLSCVGEVGTCFHSLFARRVTNELL